MGTALLQDKSNVLYLYGNPSGLKESLVRKKSHVRKRNRAYYRAYIYSIAINTAQQNMPSISYNHSSCVGAAHCVKFGWKISLFSDYLIKMLLNFKHGISMD